MDTTDSAYGDKLVRLDTFDTAVAVDPSAEDDAKRRFMTLILQTAHRNNGNIGHVLRATNTSGEVFAVKLLKDNAILSGQAPDRSAEQSAAHLANTAALGVLLTGHELDMIGDLSSAADDGGQRGASVALVKEHTGVIQHSEAGSQSISHCKSLLYSFCFA